MRTLSTLRILAGALLLSPLLTPAAARAGRVRRPEAPGHQSFVSPQSNPIVVSADGSRVFVANTTSNTVSILETAPLRQRRQVEVGLEPVSLALRPGGRELWVSNHVSDSVSVVDVDPSSASFGLVVETVQALDPHGATLFDEPVGIAFASADKAYVALSSRNQVAVIDANTYQVTGWISIGVGAVLLIMPGITVHLLFVLVGIWAVFQGGSLFMLSRDFPNGDPDRSLLTGIAIAGVLIGLLLIFWPGSGAVAISWVIAVVALVTGSMLVYMGLHLRRAGRAL